MKNIFLFLVSVLLCFNANAQNIPNPYASIGKPSPKIRTLSNGNYDEFFIKDSIVLICGEAVSRKTGETIYSSDGDSLEVALLEKKQEEKFRFLSVDPKAADYPFYTPYQFAGNEPIAAIDLDGLEPAYLKPNGGYVTARDGALQQPLSQQGQAYFASRGFGAKPTLAAESMGLDAVPVVGTVKGWIEAGTGSDLLTGEEIPTWVRWASVIPYGKFSKYVKHADDVAEQVAKHGDEAIDMTKNVVEHNADEIVATTKYKRPNNATTKAQRQSVQGKPCVDCGTKADKMIADHKKPLVKEHYETGGINKKKMHDVDAVQPQCPTCSSKQGGQLSKYSKEQAKKIDGNK